MDKRVIGLLAVAFLVLYRPLILHAEKTGWPIEVNDNVYSSPALADIDGDGKLEVIVGVCGAKGEAGTLYVWRYDGTTYPGWPQTAAGRIQGSSPVVGNLDPNYEGMEIVSGTSKGKVYIWHKDGTLMDGWPKTLPGGVSSSPVIADLNGDERLDIIVSCADGKVYAYTGSGDSLSSWPQNTGAPIYSTPAVEDINRDGRLEVLVCNSNGKACLWDAKGQIISGWPKEGLGNKTPAVGDLDPKYKGLEMVFSGKNEIDVLHSDGTPLAGWPKQIQTPGSPVVGDIDGDGTLWQRDLEVAVSSDRGKEVSPLLCAWHADGKIVTGWPVDSHTSGSYPIAAAPVLKDLDGDGKLEIIIGSTGYAIYAWRSDGTHLGNFPIQGIGMQFNSPAIADLDDDGRVEIVFGDVSSVLKVHVFEMSLPYR